MQLASRAVLVKEFELTGVQPGAEAVRRVVGERNGLFLGGELADDEHGPKDLQGYDQNSDAETASPWSNHLFLDLHVNI
jgi:hypothetical protein